MQITVPTTLGAQPLKIIIGGVAYSLGAGETIDVPDSVVEEMNRMILAKTKTPPPVEQPFTDKAAAALETRVKTLEDVPAELPDLPAADGTYALQLVMDDDVPTKTWVTGGNSGPLVVNALAGTAPASIALDKTWQEIRDAVVGFVTLFFNPDGGENKVGFISTFLDDDSVPEYGIEVVAYNATNEAWDSFYFVTDSTSGYPEFSLNG